MENLILSPTDDLPKVVLNMDGTFELSKRALPEDPAGFFKPVLDWLKEYSKSPAEETVLKVKLDYFNTASSKILLDIFSILEGIENAKVEWYSLDDDEDMEEAGEEYADMVDVPFECFTYAM